MPVVRHFEPKDLAGLYHIALITGDAGADASALYRDGRLLGEIYAAPYARLSPALAFVVEDDEGVGGYIVGALDTRRFEATLEAEWWPELRTRHPDPGGAYTEHGPDDRLRWLIHRPARSPGALVADFPSHLHINLAPRLQGRGFGRRLMDTWLSAARDAGSRGAHLGVAPANARAIAFYRAYGLVEPAFSRPPAPGALWLATSLAP